MSFIVYRAGGSERLPGPFHPLAYEWKAIIAPVQWSVPDASDGAINFLVPLDINGVTIEGLFLRGRAYESAPDRDVMFQLEITTGLRSRTPLRRVDWLPRSGRHKNPDKGEILGSHQHLFEPNWIEGEQRMRAGNLPWAEAIPATVSTYASLLDFTADQFRIQNITAVPQPEWSAKLL
tara:strand:+ start:5540 stop:6073 length:534 start_codon:yes stop_codon:yes gene_type:complete